MKSYFEQETLAYMRHEELLARAAWERRFAHLRHERTLSLPALFQQLAEQTRRWFTPRQSATADRVATTSRQQVC